MVILSVNMEKKKNKPSVGKWEGNNVYPVPVIFAPGKKIHGCTERQEDLEECIQVCESWGGCPVLSGNIAEIVGWFWVFHGLDLPNKFSLEGQKKGLCPLHTGSFSYL